MISHMGWTVLIAANMPLYIGLGWVIFRTWDKFWEAVRFWFTPDLLSALRGEYYEDWVGELKLGLWIALCVGCVWAESALINIL